MTRFCDVAVIGSVLFVVGLALLVPAFARPPIASVSPGYDRRLVESRKALLVSPAYERHSRHGRWKLHQGH